MQKATIFCLKTWSRCRGSCGVCPALNTELPNNIVYKKLSLLEVILPDPQQWSLCIYVQRTRVQLVKLSAILGITYILYNVHEHQAHFLLKLFLLRLFHLFYIFQ